MENFPIKAMDDAIVRAALESIFSDYKGQDIIEAVGYHQPICPVPAIPTGSMSLDLALGIGGIPKGRLTIVTGDPGTGKSTLCLEIIKSEQRIEPGKLNIYVDNEAGAFDDLYAYTMGVDLDPNKFIKVSPNYAEQGLSIIERLISTGKVGVCVWDSIAGSFSKESAENTAEDSDSLANMARLLSQNLRKLANKCGKTGTALILVNQVRTQMARSVTWNDITGGKAQKYYASVRIDLSKEKIRDFSGKVDRETITAEIPRNKVAVQYKQAMFDIKLGQGIIREGNTLDVACDLGLVKARGGGWFYFYDLETGEELASIRSRSNAVDYLVEHSEYAEELEKRILGFKTNSTYTQEDIDEYQEDSKEQSFESESTGAA